MTLHDLNGGGHGDLRGRAVKYPKGPLELSGVGGSLQEM